MNRESTDETVPQANILIVEDEEGPREALKLILSPYFNLYTVDRAEVAEVVETPEVADGGEVADATEVDKAVENPTPAAPTTGAPQRVLSRERPLGESLHELERQAQALLQNWNDSPWNPRHAPAELMADWILKNWNFEHNDFADRWFTTGDPAKLVANGYGAFGVRIENPEKITL